MFKALNDCFPVYFSKPISYHFALLTVLQLWSSSFAGNRSPKNSVI